MNRRRWLLALGALGFTIAGFARAALDDDLTVTNTSRAAYMQPFAFVTTDALQKFRGGSGIFRQPWLVGRSADEPRFDGLGPLSNRLSCVGCHIGNGRGETSASETDVLRGALVRLSVPGKGQNGEPLPEPVYGDQLQSGGIIGVPSEGDASIRWNEVPQVLADGTRVSLRRPELVFKNLHYGPLAHGVMSSVRMAPSVYGLGLLAAVPDSELLVRTDPTDADGNGISGRVNRVWDSEQGQMAIGRFGLKANQPNLRQQAAAALIGDMGITSRLFMDQNCTAAENACKAAMDGGNPEISDADLATLVAYLETIAPPAPRDGGETAKHGAVLFERFGCAACHAPSLKTGAQAAIPQIAGRTIHPYTDILLHDMGEELADGRPDFEASGRDWRTAPLWGIGLAGAVLPRPAYLHDGRARNLVEAILWHGGEAERARAAFAAASAVEREAILAFLNTL